MSGELVIYNNVFITPPPPPGWLDGIEGFWWNLVHWFPWLPDDPSEWKLALNVVMLAVLWSLAMNATIRGWARAWREGSKP